MEKKFKVGDSVLCKAFGPLKHNFTGKVEKIYENSALIRLDQYDPEDKIAVGDLHNQAIVRLKEMKHYKDGMEIEPAKIKKSETNSSNAATNAENDDVNTEK